MELVDLVKENQELHEKVLALEQQLSEAQRQLKNLKSASENGVRPGLQSKRFKMVTVMYSNIVGLDTVQNTDNPQGLGDDIDAIWRKFNQIVSKYNIRKVKSIGDSYMCAGGIPEKNHTNPMEMVLASMEIVRYLQTEKNIWNINLGIHTGSVVATISGKKKPSFELKGDAANIACRIESYSRTNKVVISEMTKMFAQDVFKCDPIGFMPAKYTGVIKMYEVVGFKPKYSDDANLQITNYAFLIKFLKVQFPDLEEYILTRLEKELPSYLHYHNVKHTMDVLVGVEVIGTAENITDEEEMLLLRTAALFHDMGQIVQSEGHENISSNYAREILPLYHYTQEQIEKICSLIMATHLPPKPKTLMECIICDADLDYLGRSDFIPVSDTLYEELRMQNLISDKNTWNKQQIEFISAHTYFTNFAKNNREVNKQNQVKRLQSLIR